MDRAIAAGLPPNVLGLLLTARRAWWGETDWPAAAELHAILTCPQARDVDEMLWQAIRRRVRR
ncbi:hypothetical protein [Cellulomonas sp.]|uniref:hypothetical protein n=1 Tax=Cellulomonas sp. TaxID=40001 RepID=UPI002D57A54C|nr:hypothetical protein [Cellulomonas sp.]HYQ76191.1 hypothetical protein [Cellulomonas sp.]